MSDNSVSFEILLDDKTRAGIESAKKGMDSLECDVVQQQELIKSLEVQLAKLHEEMAREGKTSMVDPENLATVEALKVKIKELSIALEQYEAQAGKPSQNTIPAIDATRKKFDGLQWQVNQFARELPALAMGPQMFFLAISNNLPMLTDEIKKAKIEYKELLAQGGKGTPVWKQMLSSILSWQTALVVGITLLVTYGKEIGEFIGGLFGVEKAVDQNIESMKEFQQKVSDGMGKNIATINGLSVAWGELGDDLDAKKRFIDENKSSFDSLGASVNNVNDVEKLLVAGKDAFIESLTLRAKAAAAMELASEQYKKGVEKMLEADAMPKSEKVATYSKGKYTGDVEVESRDVVLKRFEASKIFKLGDDLITKYSGYSDEQKKKLESINFSIQDVLITGSVAAIEKSIATKREALKKLTNKADYDKAMVEMKAEEAKLQAIIGGERKVDPKPINDINEYRIEARRKVEENVIALMEEGAEKQKAILKQKYDDEIEVIDKNERALMASYDRLRKSGVSVDGNEVKATKAYYDVARQQAGEKLQKSVAGIDSKTEDERVKKERKELDALLHEFESYSHKRARIAQQYDDKIALLTKNGETERAMEAQVQRTKTLSDLDNSVKRSTNVISDLFSDMNKKSVKSMRDIANKAEEYLSFLQGDYQLDNVYGLTEEQFKQMKQNVEELDRIRIKIEEINQQADRAEPVIDRLSKSLSRVRLGNLTDGQLKNELKGIGSDLNTLNESAKNFVSIIGSVGKIIGEETAFGRVISNISQSAQEILNVGKAYSDTLAAGGTQTDASLNALTTSTEQFANQQSANRKRREQHMANVEAFNLRVKLANLDINQVYRERYQWARKIGESQLTHSKRVGDEAKKQSTDNAADQKRLLEQLYSQEYVESMKFKKTGLFGLGSGKEVKQMASLRGLSLDQIEILRNQGKLTQEAEAYYNALVKAKQEGENIDKLLQEQAETIREMTVGSSYESVVNRAMDALKNGTKTAAETFDEIMEEAVESSLKLLLDEGLRKWYEDFAKMGEDGYTKEEIAKAKADYQATLARQEAKKKALEETTGVVIGGSDVEQKAASKSFTTMSQDQAGKLEGLFTASEMRVASIDATTKEVRQSLDSVNETLVKIEENTSTTNDLLDEVKEVLDDIKKNGLTMK